MADIHEERSVRSVRSGFADFNTALAYVVQRFDREYRDATNVQVVIEQMPEGGWSAMIYGSHVAGIKQ